MTAKVKINVSAMAPAVKVRVGEGATTKAVPKDSFVVIVTRDNIIDALGFTPIESIKKSDVETALGFTPLKEITKNELIRILGYTPLNAVGGMLGALSTKYNSPSSAGRIAFFNGATPAEGAGIWLYGNDCDGKGKFSLQVYDVETSTYRNFLGFPNGDLQWNGGWLNPPMVAGTEYKTIERYQGKAVYAKLVDAGALPNNSSKTVSLGASTPNIISFDAIIEDGTYTVKLPYINPSGAVMAFFYVKSGSGTFITLTDLSAYNAKILVKYTK